MSRFLFLLIAFSFCYLFIKAQTVTKYGKVNLDSISNRFSKHKLYLGRVEVYESNFTNKGKKISLVFHIVKGNKSIKPPILAIQGGPGRPSSTLIEFFIENFADLLADRDFIFIDQRGTGLSNPLAFTLNSESMQALLDERFSDSIVLSNYTRLTKTNDLSQYTTLHASKDIETLRKILGIKKLSIYGTSYGTRLAMTFAAQYPASVDKLVLKGIVPPNKEGIDLLASFDGNVDMALSTLNLKCKEDSACSAKYSLLNDFQKVSDYLEKNDIQMEVTDRLTSKKEAVRFNKANFTFIIRSLLASPSSAKDVPYLMNEAAGGNYRPLVETTVNARRSYLRNNFEGLAMSVFCREDINPKKDAQSGFWKEKFVQACKIWQVPALNTTEIFKNKIKAETLLISGEMDPATPPENGNRSVKYFNKVKHIIVNYGGHSFNNMSGCVDKLMIDFYNRGLAAYLDSPCVKEKRKYPAFK